MKCPNKLTLLLLLSALALISCSDDESGSEIDEDEVEETALFSIVPQTTRIQITEGAGLAEVPLNIIRDPGHELDIALSTATRSEVEAANLTSAYSDALISSEENSTTLRLNLAISARPIMDQERTVVVTALDTSGNRVSTDITLEVEPTNLPDIYLLVGQSNMVGSSEFNAKESNLGEVDASNDRIMQLNVTFNDTTNFSSEEDFTDPVKLYNTDNPLTVALDPLHSGLESDGTKGGTQIGMGLSFAKSALGDTTSTIYLVPAAWSDTGFCSRETNILPGIGWNATEPTNSAFSGTLLYDRAIARANAAIELTGGILRGILWHQGEADSDDQVCADSYEDNLVELVQALRQNIDTDARGASARGADADIPFVAGTLSMGEDQLPFSDVKLTVDAALRNLPNLLDYTATVNGDDLAPPQFACGNGSCIHFGAAALRELGVRYYQQLESVLP